MTDSRVSERALFCYNESMGSYSNKTLLEKLGIKSEMRLFFFNQPKGYAVLLGKLPPKVKLLKKLARNTDFLHYFTVTKADLNKAFPKLKKHLKKDGILWVSWPKNSHPMTDLKENIVRNLGLQHGLVDIKVVAIDGTWSGLKFVWRFADR